MCKYLPEDDVLVDLVRDAQVTSDIESAFHNSLSDLFLQRQDLGLQFWKFRFDFVQHFHTFDEILFL